MGRLQAMPGRLGGMAPKLRPAAKVAETFYTSPEWRKLVASIRRRRGNRCQRPDCETPMHRVIADHIRERKDGGEPLDPANIELLCFTHHQRKTAAARKQRARGHAG